MMVRPLVRRWALRGPLRPAARAAHHALVAGQLAAERIADGVLARPEAVEHRRALDELTLLVKTFERPGVLHRLLLSIRRFYPDVHVVVVDDSRVPAAVPGVELVTLPFDSGVSAGRAAGLARVRTPYVMVLDDDFVFYRHTRAADALALLRAEPRIDLMGGAVVNLPLRKVADYRRAALYPTDAQPVHPCGTRLAGLEVYDKVPNFFLARTDRLRRVGWDPRILRADHGDFFTRARGVLTTVYNPALRCLHARTPFDAAYMAHRMDMARDAVVIRARYSHPAPPPAGEVDSPAAPR